LATTFANIPYEQHRTVGDCLKEISDPYTPSVWPKFAGRPALSSLGRVSLTADGEAQSHHHRHETAHGEPGMTREPPARAEADGNRTRQTGRAGLYGFEAP